MSELDENSSKRRKLNVSEDLTSSFGAASGLIVDDSINAVPSEPQATESEANGLSKIDAFEKTKENSPLSKSQLKKRRRAEKWEAAKELRKDKRRDKRHEKQARKAQERAELQEKIEKGEIEVPKISPEELRSRHARAVQVPVTFILDCDFDSLMTEKELISLGAQLTRCYSDNRHSKHRAHMVISSWNGALRTRFETVLTNHHKSWKGVRFMEKDFVGAAEDMNAVMRRQDGGKLVGAIAPHDGKTLDNNGILGKNGETGKDNENENIIVGDKSHLLRKCPAGVAPTEAYPIEKIQELPRPVPEEPMGEFPSLPSIAPESATHPLATLPGSTSSSVPAILGEDATADGGTASTATEPSLASEPSVVYLTSDSPNTLDRLSPYTSYIIGGIVDKNRHKGLCYKRACGRGVHTAKLPIGEYMTMQSRSVLATNHVVEIMLKWLETGDWGEAFLSVIPKRKEAKLKTKGESGHENGKDESESEDVEEVGVRLDDGDKE